jgi:hypothetical protein
MRGFSAAASKPVSPNTAATAVEERSAVVAHGGARAIMLSGKRLRP